MFSQLEKDVEKAVSKYAKKEYGWTFRKQQGQGNRGKADRFFINSGGRIVFVEFKRSGKPLSPLQEEDLIHFRDKGFIAVGIDNIEDGEWFFDNIEANFFTPDRLSTYPLMVCDFPNP